MRQLEDGFFVSGQVLPEEMPALAAAGIRTIVNNRPDGEAPDQPPGSAVAAAAHAAGIAYHHVPMAQLTPELVEGMHAALRQAEGPVLAFCAIGRRSTFLWALARSHDGAQGDELAEKAAAAGYDLTPIRRFLR